MTSMPMAEIDIQPGHHQIIWHVGPFTFNGDTIIATVIAGIIVCGLGFYIRSRLSVRKPGKAQLFYEAVTDQVEKEVDAAMGVQVAPFVVPLGFSLFLFILVANWLALIPTKEYIPPPASDPNLTYALAVFVIVTMHVMGVKKNGARRYYGHLWEKPRILVPLRLLEEIIKPFTLALRLFGNIFAGVIMLALIAALPVFVLWLPEILWKLFDAFIGLIQAFIFGLLTILYMASLAPHKGAHEVEPHGRAAPELEEVAH